MITDNNSVHYLDKKNNNNFFFIFKNLPSDGITRKLPDCDGDYS